MHSLFSHALKSTRAAIDLASVMVGIIIIGIVGGVIAATIFAVIPWSQDNGAKQQLDSVVTGESAVKGIKSTYSPNLKGYLNTDKLAVSKVRIQSDGDTYAAYSKSQSGNYYYITSSNTKPQLVGKVWPANKPSTFPDSISWPVSWDAAAIQSTGQSPLIANPEQLANWPSGQVSKVDASASGVPSDSPLTSVLRLNNSGDTLQSVDYTKQPLSDTSTVWQVSAWVSTTSDTQVSVALGTWLGQYGPPPLGGVLQTNVKISKSDGWVHVVKNIGIDSTQSDATTSWWYSQAMLGQQYNWRAYMSTNADGAGKVYVTGLQISKVK
jgi:hypothetical protein